MKPVWFTVVIKDSLEEYCTPVQSKEIAEYYATLWRKSENLRHQSHKIEDSPPAWYVLEKLKGIQKPFASTNELPKWLLKPKT